MIRLSRVEKETVLEAVSKYGAMARAAGRMGRTVAAVRREAELDPNFAAQLEQAELEYQDCLQGAARLRAVDGIERAIYYKGAVVGHETEFSDTLLQTLLKAKVPAFADKQRIDLNGRLEGMSEDDRMSRVLALLTKARERAGQIANGEAGDPDPLS